MSIPQGSVLGSTLYLVHINELSKLNSLHGKIGLYVDEIPLLFNTLASTTVLYYAQKVFNVVNNRLKSPQLFIIIEKN